MNWDYIAGFIDGEGSIIISPPRVRLFISNTDKRVLEKIRDFSKLGTIIEVKRKENPKWKKSYVWNLGSHKDCLTVLKKLKNKLIIKKDKCKKAISFIKNKRWLGDYISKKELEKFKNMSYRKIAKRLGISHYCVFRYLKKYGLR